MNSRLLSMVTALVGMWTAIYTAGMPQPLRQIRRNEIASDLWECSAEVVRGDQQIGRAAAEILARLFFGIPDDIFWRWEKHMNATSTQGQVPRWLNATSMGLPLSAVGLYFAMAFAKALNETPVAVAIRESAYIFPVVLTLHVIGICAFIGFAAMVDLRVLGWTLKRTSVIEVGESLLPWAMGGFALVFLSGAFIYLAEPVRYLHNSFFNLKLISLFVGGLNAWIGHRRVFRHSSEWQATGRIPSRDKIGAIFSLLVWGLLIVAGRGIGFAS
jgi:hypothetical protein